MNREESYTHPSFGQMYIGRVQSRNTHFYGSELPQDSYIVLELSSSEVTRELKQDRYYSIKPLVKVRMSSMQFSEMITSLNQGGGSCCTIEYLIDKKITPLPLIM